jgi:hypothetical protein
MPLPTVSMHKTVSICLMTSSSIFKPLKGQSPGKSAVRCVCFPWLGLEKSPITLFNITAIIHLCQQFHLRLSPYHLSSFDDIDPNMTSAHTIIIIPRRANSQCVAIRRKGH